MICQSPTIGLSTRRSRVDMQRILNTPVKRILIAYLHRHPYTYDHLEGLATRIAQPVDALRRATDDLVLTGILLNMGDGPRAVYAINKGDGWLEEAGAYFERNPTAQVQLDNLLASLFAM